MESPTSGQSWVVLDEAQSIATDVWVDLTKSMSEIWPFERNVPRKELEELETIGVRCDDQGWIKLRPFADGMVQNNILVCIATALVVDEMLQSHCKSKLLEVNLLKDIVTDAGLIESKGRDTCLQLGRLLYLVENQLDEVALGKWNSEIQRVYYQEQGLILVDRKWGSQLDDRIGIMRAKADGGTWAAAAETVYRVWGKPVVNVTTLRSMLMMDPGTHMIVKIMKNEVKYYTSLMETPLTMLDRKVLETISFHWDKRICLVEKRRQDQQREEEEKKKEKEGRLNVNIINDAGRTGRSLFLLVCPPHLTPLLSRTGWMD